MAPSTDNPLILGAVVLATLVMFVGIVTWVVRTIVRARHHDRHT